MVAGERPYFLSPLAATAQVINIALPGKEPPIYDEVVEDCTLWGGPVMLAVGYLFLVQTHPCSTQFVQQPMTQKQRKNFFAKSGRTTTAAPLQLDGKSSTPNTPSAAQKETAPRPYSFQPGLIYTMDFYQHMLIPATLELKIPALGTYDVARYINCQPIQMMTKLWGTKNYLWNFEAWHEKLLPAKQ